MNIIIVIILNYIEKGKEHTDLVIGGEQIKIDGKGCFIQPTIFNNVNSNDGTALWPWSRGPSV